MSESNPWSAQWFNAQQQFVDAWSDMAKSGVPGNSNQSDLWAQSFDLWRKASGEQVQPDFQQAMNKCMDMGKGYFAMAEQITKNMGAGAKPTEAINQWMEQLKQSLQQFGSMPGLNGGAGNDFMKQWFNPASSWQQMTAGMMPMNQGAWQMPGMNTPSFNLGEMIDPLGTLLEAPSVGYFREPQAKQQKGIQLALEYQQANQAFNQAFLKVAMESIQGFQARILKTDTESAPKTLRELYDLWIEISEEHYAEFAMGEEYQELYGDMVNRLMVLKKHYSEIADDTLKAMNLPNTREIDTMQERLQQLRRDNFALKKEISEIRSMLQQVMGSKPATANTTASTAAPAAAPTAASKAKKAPRKSATKATTAGKPVVKTVADSKPAVKKAAVKKAAAVKAAPKATARKTVAPKSAPKKKTTVTKASKGA